MKIIRNIATTSLALFGVNTVAHAAAVAVPNGDFEDRTGAQYFDAANWTITGAGASGGYTTVSGNPTIFTTDAAGDGATGGSGGDGGTYLFLQTSLAPTATSDNILSAVTDTQYTATVMVGEPITAYAQRPANPMIEILLNGVSVASNTLTPPADDSWALLSVSYTATAGDAGDQLQIRLSDSTGTQSFFDNVTLDATAVPEPSSAALLGLGGLALILRRRK